MFGAAQKFLIPLLVAGTFATAQQASAVRSSPPPGVVNLATYPHLTLQGEPFLIIGTGRAAAGAGDVNGDGRRDTIVGAPSSRFNGRPESGSAFVVFGGLGPGTLGLDSLGGHGFRIDGAATGDGAGWDVAGAGDLNDDGLDDVVVGAFGADNNGRIGSGSAYVVFGKATNDTIDLAALGAQGFRVDGAAAGDAFTSFSPQHTTQGAGDVNGDGVDDIVIGAGYAANNGRTRSGSAWVVYGKASATIVDLAALGDGGFRIDGAREQDALEATAGAGDVDGDGFDDVVVGSKFATNDAGERTGSAAVVFGGPGSADVDLAAIDSSGFLIKGIGGATGVAVDGAGDVDRDGLADVVVGASAAGGPGLDQSGVAFVVFGRRATRPVDLAKLRRDGFRIDGAVSLERVGFSVAGAGDVNRDRFADVVLGAPTAEHNGSTPQGNSGSAYVVLGSRSYRTVDMASDPYGFRIDGGDAGDGAGTDVDGVGDVDLDGRADVILGAPDPNAQPGSAHVVPSPPCRRVGRGRGNGARMRGFCVVD